MNVPEVFKKKEANIICTSVAVIQNDTSVVKG